jgi:hypothetical protein
VQRPPPTRAETLGGHTAVISIESFIWIEGFAGHVDLA